MTPDLKVFLSLLLATTLESVGAGILRIARTPEGSNA